MVTKLEALLRLRRDVDKDKMRREVLEQSLNKERARETTWTTRYQDALEARAVLTEVAQATQKNIEDSLASLVTMALQAVFPYKLKCVVEFGQKRNKSECEIWVEQEGEKMKPMDATGGGVVDVMSFAFRVAFWALKKTRPVLILDEPMKFLSRDYQPKAAEMIKMISEKLGVQFVMITHIPELAETADNVITIGRRDNV
jgi:DNA repair exonuclease SbcCD ATPase subunit